MTVQNDKPSSPGTRPVQALARQWLRTTLVNGQRDPFSYLWLGLATVLLPFSTLRWSIPLVAWFVPVFLLRFLRTQPLVRGTVLALLASVVGWEVALLGFWGPVPGGLGLLLGCAFGVVYPLPFLVDRVVVPRMGGLLGTLIFPLAVTTLWYLNAVLNPLAGAWGNPAYSQYGNLPLLQLLSLTGLWGVVFLMSWFASVVNWAWEIGFAWPQIRGGAALYGGLLALVLGFGGARLALFPAQGNTVRVAGISPARALQAAADHQLSQHVSQQARALLSSSTATATQREHARQAVVPTFAQAFAPVNQDLLARSAQEASAGAKIVVWNEGGAEVLQEDEPALLGQASTLARSTGAYLDMGIGVLLQQPGPSHVFLDEIVLVSPSGSVLWHFEKIHQVGGVETGREIPGVDRVPIVRTPYGRLSNVVCFDADFPATIRQAGQAGADMLLVPSNDWSAIDPVHTQIITFRAIENGFSLVRPTSNGLSMTVDDEGRVLSAVDYFTTDAQVMVASVPMHGVHTLYAVIGDLFAWLSMAGLVGLIGWVIARQRQAGGRPAPGALGRVPSTDLQGHELTRLGVSSRPERERASPKE
jgi:apolipoprotein N-acyltransferase